MDPAALKKEVTKIYKKLQSNNLKKRVDALKDLERLVAMDPRAVLPMQKALNTLLINGEEEERFLAISLVRGLGNKDINLARPFIGSLKVNATYNIFDPNLNFYKPGCKIRKNAIYTIYSLAKRDDSILTPDLAELISTNFEPPIYVSDKDRPKDMTDLYASSLLLAILISKSMPEVIGEHVTSYLHLLSDPNQDIKIQAAIIVEKISRTEPERLKGHLSPVMALLKYPNYRPDIKDEKMVSIYISAVAIMDNVAQAHPEWLADAVNILSSALRDTYKYERWIRDHEEKGEDSFRAIIKSVLEKIAMKKPGLIVPLLAEHLKSVEDLRNYVKDLLIKVSGKDPRIPVEAVVPMLSVDNVNAKQAALDVLAGIGATNPDAVKPYLTRTSKCLEDRYIHVRQKASFALGQIGKAKPEYVVQFVPQMVPLLSDSYESVKLSTIEAFINIGTNHPKYVVPAIPSLIKLLDDNNKNVRDRAQEAISALNVDVDTYLSLIKSMQGVNKRITAAKAKGAPTEDLEERFQGAKREMQEAHWAKAHDIIKGLESEIEALLERVRPEIKVDIHSNRPLSDSRWEDVVVDVANSGNAHAKDININFEGAVEVSGTKYVPVLESRSGVEMKMSARLSDKSGGNVKVHVDFKDFDNKEYSLDISGTYNPGEGLSISSSALKTAEEPQTKEVEGAGVKGEEKGEGEFVVMEVVNDWEGGGSATEDTAESGGDGAVEEHEASGVEGAKGQPEEVTGPEGDAADRWKKIGVEDVITCPHCGTTIPSESVFCYKCGKKVKP